MPVSPLLIVVLFALFLPTWLYILKRDDLVALAYSMLFVYTIFTEIGYVFYPELSAREGLLFGPDVFMSYAFFVLLSFACTFIVFVLSTKAFTTSAVICLRRARNATSLLFLFYLVTATLTGYIVYDYIRLRPQLSYSITEYDITPEVITFLFVVRLYALVVLVLWARWRDRTLTGGYRRGTMVLTIIALTAYVTIASAIGSRSDILNVAIGIGLYELHPIAWTVRRNTRKIVIIVASAVPVLYCLLVLEYVRAHYNPITVSILAEHIGSPECVFGTDGTLAERILTNDYYWPSHLLMSAIDRDCVIPSTVLRSNAANSLAGLGSPYLTEVVTSRAVASERADRLRGFAFYFFTEGWLAAGWAGCLYNGVLLNTGLALWRLLTRTSEPAVTRVLLAFVASAITPFVRSQSSIFVRWTWTQFVFGVVLLILGSGWRPYRWRRTTALSISPGAVLARTI